MFFYFILQKLAECKTPKEKLRGKHEMIDMSFWIGMLQNRITVRLRIGPSTSLFGLKMI